MNKLATLSNPILFAIAFMVLVAVYFVAIKPTVLLYQQVNVLENQQQQNDLNIMPKGNLQELNKLESLLSPLENETNIQSLVLNAVGNRTVKLQSFKEEKIEDKEYGGIKNLKKYVLTVSGNYRNLLDLCGDLKPLAISSSNFYINDQQEEFLSLDILESTDKTSK
jgi:hypothetical protein